MSAVQKVAATSSAVDSLSSSDGELLDRYVAMRGNEDFSEIMKRHGPMVLGVCRRLLRNASDADDAFQATFLVLVKKAETIWPRIMLGNWLYGVAFRTALKAKAMRKRREVAEARAARSDEQKSSDTGWLNEILDLELNRLPGRFRLPVVLCELEGMTLKEAAERLALPLGTVASRLARGRKQLVQRLSLRGIAVAAGTGSLFASGYGCAAVPERLASSTLEAVKEVTTTGVTAATAASNGSVALADAVVQGMFVSKALRIAILVTSSILAVAAVVVAARPVWNKPQNVWLRDNWPRGSELVIRARAFEAWFPKVRLFHARAEAPPNVVNRQLRAEATNPSVAVDFAFDGKRVCDRVEVAGNTMSLQIWADGRIQGLRVFHNNNEPPKAWVTTDIAAFQQTSLDEWGWLKSTYHKQWFMSERSVAATTTAKRGEPSEYRTVGRTQYRGVPSWVVYRFQKQFERWFISEATGMLLGIQEAPIGGIRAVDELARTISGKFGANADTLGQFDEWLQTLPGETRDSIYREFLDAGVDLIQPKFEYWCDDYREVVPGRWLPYKHGRLQYVVQGGVLKIRDRRDWTVTNVTFDAPIDESLFTFPASGLDRKPIAFEFANSPGIVDHNEPKAAMSIQDRIHFMNQLGGGKPPPFHAKGHWINSKPIDWDSLRGKVVLLEFWGSWCGPCTNDYPTLRGLYQDALDDRIALIAIHTASDDIDAVRAYAAQHDLRFPILVDHPGNDNEVSRAWGKQFGFFGVAMLPYAFVIMADGRIGYHGDIQEMRRRAVQELAKKQH